MGAEAGLEAAVKPFHHPIGLEDDNWWWDLDPKEVAERGPDGGDKLGTSVGG